MSNFRFLLALLLLASGLVLSSFSYKEEGKVFTEQKHAALRVNKVVLNQPIETFSDGDNTTYVYEYELPSGMLACTIGSIQVTAYWNYSDSNNKKANVSVFTPVGGIGSGTNIFGPNGASNYIHIPSPFETKVQCFINTTCNTGTNCSPATVVLQWASGNTAVTDLPGGGSTFGSGQCS